MNKQLYRSRTNKMFGGVAGGIAEYFDIDPVIVRIGFVATVFFWGFSGILYFVLWAIIPAGKQSVAFSDSTIFDSDAAPSPAEKPVPKAKDRTIQIIAFFLILLGSIKTIDYFLPHFDFSVVFAFILVGCGFGLLLKKKK